MQVLTGHGQNKYYSKEVIFYKSLSEKKKGDKVMIRKKWLIISSHLIPKVTTDIKSTLLMIFAYWYKIKVLLYCIYIYFDFV